MTDDNMEQDKVLRDPLESISGYMRKAVTLNKSQWGSLQSTVTQIKRERHRTVNSLAKQQDIFRRRQCKILPAMRLRTLHRRKASNHVIPLTGHTTASSGTAVLASGDHGPRSRYAVLPSIADDHEDNNADDIAMRTRRMTEYQKEVATLKKSLSNASNFGGERLPRLGDIPRTNDAEDTTSTLALDPSSRKYNVKTEENLSSDKRRDPKELWKHIRENLQSLLSVAQKIEEDEDQRMFDEIRKCRYIRKHKIQEDIEAEESMRVNHSAKQAHEQGKGGQGHPEHCPCYLCSLTLFWQRSNNKK